MFSGASRKIVIDWQNFLRHICCQYLINYPVQMGRPGRTVEIDESKFMHRKYYRGAYHEGYWVLGMVEQESNLCMTVAVESRSADVLIPIIAQHALPGTRVLTDGWAAYNQLPQHKAVNHRLHFVDPNDRTPHKYSRRQLVTCEDQVQSGGTSDSLFNSYLKEFLW